MCCQAATYEWKLSRDVGSLPRAGRNRTVPPTTLPSLIADVRCNQAPDVRVFWRTGTIAPVKKLRRVCYAGTWELDYPRNTLIIQALRDAGVRVETCHRSIQSTSGGAWKLAPATLLLLALRVVVAYLLLIPDVALRLLRCDALVVGYIGQLDMLVLGTLARIMGRPVIFNPLVSLTDTLIEDRQRVSSGSLPGRLIGLVDRVSMRLASLVLADTEQNAAFFAERFGVDADRLAVVQVGVPDDIFQPVERPANRIGSLDVLFVGKFIPLHGVDTIIRAAALLRQRGAAVRIELVGTGQHYAAARELAARLKADNIVWTDWIPFSDLGRRTATADVVLGIFDTGAKAGRVIPNKVHQALASAVPVVTADTPAIQAFLEDGVSAMLVPPADPVALADAIEHLQDAALRSRIGRQGHDSWQAWGSRAALAEQVRRALDQLADRS